MTHHCHRVSQDALRSAAVCVFRGIPRWGVCDCLSRLSLHVVHTDSPCEILTVFAVNASQGDRPNNFVSNNYESSRLCRCEDGFLLRSLRFPPVKFHSGSQCWCSQAIIPHKPKHAYFRLKRSTLAWPKHTNSRILNCWLTVCSTSYIQIFCQGVLCFYFTQLPHY